MNYGSEQIFSDRIMLELYESSDEVGSNILVVESLIMGLFDWDSEKMFFIKNNSQIQSYVGLAQCHVDAACEEADELCKQKNSICLIRTLDNNGKYASQGTGVLLNNVRVDYKPYILTAKHVIDGKNISDAKFRFRYIKTECDGSDIESGFEFFGSELKSSLNWTDFALLELLESLEPGEHYFQHLYFAGWDRRNIPPDTSTSLHHPLGTALKFSKDFDVADEIKWFSMSPSFLGWTHWRVNWDIGTQQHGSSGSPLFNKFGLVVGQAHGYRDYVFGGTNHCDTRLIDYGKLYVSWVGLGYPETWLKDWLDPDDSGVETLDGVGLNFYDFGVNYLNGSKAYYSDNKIIVGSSNSSQWSIASGVSMSLKAKKEIVIKACAHIKEGSNFHAYIEEPDCLSHSYMFVSDKFSKYGSYCLGSLKESSFSEEFEAKKSGCDLFVFPNPSVGIFNVRFQDFNDDFFTISIHDVAGNIIFSDLVCEDIKYSCNIDVSFLSSGIYFASLKTSSNFCVSKFIISK